MERGVLLFHLAGHGRLERVDDSLATVAGHVVVAKCHHAVGDVFLLHHETNEHILVGQLFGVALGVKAVEHIVMFHGGMAAYGFKPAMVVGEHEPVG